MGAFNIRESVCYILCAFISIMKTATYVHYSKHLTPGNNVVTRKDNSLSYPTKSKTTPKTRK